MNIFDFDSLFSDVGSKLQSVARWFYGITLTLLLVGGGIGAIWVLLNADFIIAILVIVGIVLAIGLYILVALISSWYIHGFGTLVQKAEKDLDVRTTPGANIPANYKRCPKCGNRVGMYDKNCGFCGHDLKATTVQAESDGWTCTCGKVNPQYMSTCSCGKSAREVRERKSEIKFSVPQNDTEKKAVTAAEQKAIEMCVCPDCGATLEKTDMDSIMMCPDCGRMFG